MKILKKGIAPEVIPWWIGQIVICQNCKSELELQEMDDLDRLTVKEDYVKFTCPLFGCSNEIIHKQSADTSPIRSKD